LIGAAARRVDAVGEPLRRLQALMHAHCEEMTSAESVQAASVFGEHDIVISAHAEAANLPPGGHR